METAVAGANRFEGGALLGVSGQLRLEPSQPPSARQGVRWRSHLQFDQAFFLEQVEAVLFISNWFSNSLGNPLRMLPENRQGHPG